MKLLLALAVVLITLAVLAEPSSADSPEPSIKDRIVSFGETIKQKTKTAIDDLHKSEMYKKTTNFFKDAIQKVKDQFSK